MTTPQRRRLAVSLLLIVLLAVLGRNLVRTYIAPTVLYTLWSLYYRAAGIPQFVLWGIFLGFLLVVGLRGLFTRDRRPRPPKLIRVAAQPGRVAALARQLAATDESAYFRQRVVRQLAALALDALGHRYRLTAAEARALIDSGQIPMDAALRASLERGWQRNERQIDLMKKNRTWLNDLMARIRPSRVRTQWHDPEIEAMVAFLEAELEVATSDD